MNAVPNLTDAAMLVYIKIGVWSARKLDKKQTQKTVADAGATADSARVNKHLLASADSKLKDIQRKANQIRDFIEVNTLPWDDAGNRLLSNAQALTVVGPLKTLEDEFYALVDEFVAEYPVIRAQAVANLGDMGDDSDYPQPDVVRSKFSVRVSFSPVPLDFGDVRMGMTEAQAKAWQGAHEAAIKRQTNEALRAAYERLREMLERYSDRLTPRTDDLGSLNVFKDPALDQLLARLQADVACYEPDTLRSSPGSAALAKSNVDDALRNMHALLG
jgi:hypothetical protein